MTHTPFFIEDKILFALAEDASIVSKEDFHILKNTIFAESRLDRGPSHVTLIERYQTLVDSGVLQDDLRIRKVLRKRAVRSLSGVSVISLLTKFWGCPGKCIYCPSYEGLPKSYIPGEPAVQRAEMNQFDPFLQVQNRLRSLQITGNAISKCDVRIIGGTWSVYPREYQEDFIRNIYDAHTLFKRPPFQGGQEGNVFGNPPSKGGRGVKYFSHSTEAIPYNPELIDKARENRKKDNPIEKTFWYRIIKSEALAEYKFTRQKPLLDYIVDFYCSAKHLIIELDGDSHIEQKEYDLKRTKELEGYGLKVLRYTNKEVMENIEGVIQDLLENIQTSPTPLPPLEGRSKQDFQGLPSKRIGLSTTLEEAKKRNETAESRVIGIAIETRPDWVTEEEIIRLRRYGVTRVEIGYQTTHDEVNTLNQRGHGSAESIRATRLLKDAGFKVVAHMMPGLYGSTPELDRSAMHEIFESPAYRPDELKIYPLVVTPHSELETLWREGKFVPYDDATLIPLMAELQAMIPEYVRLNRMYRDIPADEILAGSKVANLRQVTELQMKKMGMMRHDISAREIRAKKNLSEEAVFEEYMYEASGGHEWFFQIVDPGDRTIFGLARLRIPSQVFTGERHFVSVLDDAAIIREVHVFGDQIPVGYRGNNSGQHMGFGKKLLQICEKKVREFYPKVDKVAVISGVGVRGYYEKFGYSLLDEYMVKILTK